MRNRSSFILAISLIIAIGGLGATPSSAVANGNNGDVKIHEADTEVEPIDANEPKVCTFHVHGLNFDASQGMDWWVDQQPPTGTDNALSSRHVTADASGAWATEVFSLPNGHYKLYWQIAEGSVKHKVFKVECVTTGAIAVTKYNDENGNGEQDSSEGLLEGWTFAVQTAAGASAGTITTGTSGSGTLSDLAPGAYNVIETLKPGWTNTDPGTTTPTKSAMVVAGQTASLVFGNKALPTTGAIQVTKYEDVNGNGAQDAGEPLLPGWSFAVHPVEGAALGPIVTDTSGSGTLSGLMPGAYSVIEALQQGWQSTDPSDGTLTKTATVVAGQTAELVFGNRTLVPTLGSIVVTKYNDLNGNGARDQGEPVLAGWTFTLHDGVEVTFAQLATGTDGTATFAGLEPRMYYVSETMKPGWTNTDPAGEPTKTTTVVAGQTASLVFGNRTVPTLGSIVVTKYNDLNRNGVQDQGEPMLEGWSFSVRNAAGASAGTITTGTSGSGTLSGLVPGDYSVIETLQTNWHNTDPAGGTLTKTATVVEGQTAQVVFGNYYDQPTPPLGRLTVVKYHDVNRNGARDQGEPGLSGWTFSVVSGNAIIHTLVTGADGTVSVTLNHGTYSVLETQQILWTSTDPGGPAPSKGAQIGPGSAITLLFGNAQVLLPPTSETVLAIVKYHDANANRVRESTEALLAGFTFVIRDASGAMVRMATTDDSGMAVVTNLPLGVYTIVEQARTGWYNTDPGGAATQSAMLTENALGATVIFGNTTVMLPPTAQLPSTARLPSTSTDNGTTGTLLAVILGLAILTAIGFGAFRFRMR